MAKASIILAIMVCGGALLSDLCVEADVQPTVITKQSGEKANLSCTDAKQQGEKLRWIRLISGSRTVIATGLVLETTGYKYTVAYKDGQYELSIDSLVIADANGEYQMEAFKHLDETERRPLCRFVLLVDEAPEK